MALSRARSISSGKAHIVEERNSSNAVTKRYFNDGFRDVSSGINYYYDRDHLGSVREIVGSDGSTVAARYDYDPYGRVTKVSGSVDADMLYAGYYFHAASGLFLTLNRAYSADLGRWISRDPAAEAGGVNLYAYVINNPFNLIDPLGLCGKSLMNRAVNAVFGAVGGAVSSLAGNIFSRFASDVAGSGAESAFQASQLGRFYSQLQKYGTQGFRELENGRYRFYGDIKPANTPGEMAGRRLVREWDPATNSTRTWNETVDHAGQVRQVRPVTDGPKVHYTFDAGGSYTGSW